MAYIKKHLPSAAKEIVNIASHHKKYKKVTLHSCVYFSHVTSSIITTTRECANKFK